MSKKCAKILKGHNLPLMSSDHVNPSEDVQKIIKKLWRTIELHNGYGLAAPQINIMKKIIVVKYRGLNFTMINPNIIKASNEKEVEFENCLSFPGKKFLITRHKSITMEYFDARREFCELFCEGMLARIMQHELDHLIGVNIKTQQGKW